jgi:TRAP-type C4-dicarboxylate transport system permease large subunit
VLAMGLGLYMPPFGVGYYSACAIGRVDPNDPLKRIWPYLGAVLIGIVIVAAIPWLSTGFLPER